MTSRWVGTKTITANIQFRKAFWFFMCILVVLLILWLSGLMPAIKKAAKGALGEKYSYE